MKDSLLEQRKTDQCGYVETTKHSERMLPVPFTHARCASLYDDFIFPTDLK